MMINKKTVNRIVIKRKGRPMKKSLIAIVVVIIVGTSGLAIAQMDGNGKEMMGGMEKQSEKAQDTTSPVADEVDHASHH